MLNINNMPELPDFTPDKDPEVNVDEFFIEETFINSKKEETKQWVLSTVLLSKAAIEMFKPVTYARATYIYNRATGLYNIDTGEIAHWVREILVDIYVNYADKYKIKPGIKLTPIIDEVVKQVNQANIISLKSISPFNNYDGFPVNNCVIHFDDMGGIYVEKYTPDMMFTRKSPVNYNPLCSTAKAEFILKSWINTKDEKTGEEVTRYDENGNEMWEYLLQIPAQAVFQSFPGMSPFKQAYMLLGEHDSGRSTYNITLQNFFGTDNVTTKQLQSFSGKFDVGDLEAKFLNFGDDLASLEVGEGNQFKTIVGISTMTVEKKYRDSYTARMYTTHVYSANQPPSLASALIMDEAWWSRWQIVQFENHFARDPGWINRNLTPEFYEGLLILVIAEVRKMMFTGGHLSLTQDWHYVKNMWICELSVFHDFWQLSVEQAEGYYISYSSMMSTLDKWAHQFMPVPGWMVGKPDEIAQYRKEKAALLPLDSQQALTKYLKLEGIRTKMTTVNGVNGWYYKDVRFKDVAWVVKPELAEPVSQKQGQAAS